MCGDWCLWAALACAIFVIYDFLCRLLLFVKYLVRDGYDGFLVASSVLHWHVEGSHSIIMVDGYSGCLDDDPP